MSNKNPINDYIDQCIDAAIALKEHFPEQQERTFWMPFKTVYPGRVRITNKMRDDITSLLTARKIGYTIPAINQGLCITINLTKNALSPGQAMRSTAVNFKTA